MPTALLCVLLSCCGAEEHALLCRVKADSTLQSPRFGVHNLFDGDVENPESRWASARTAPPHWLEFRFDAPTEFDYLKVWGHGDKEHALCGASLEVLEKGAWRTADRIVDNTSRTVQLETGGLVGIAYRLFIDTPCREDGTARLFEVAFFRGNEMLPVRAERSEDRKASGPQPIDNKALLAAVHPFPVCALAASPHGRAAGLMHAYYASVRRWGEVLEDRFEAVPGHPEWGYYGREGNQEDDVRPITYAAFVNAFLSQAEAGKGSLGRTDKPQCRREAMAALAYLVQAHVTGPGTCLNGKPWGDQWQSAMWARVCGHGGVDPMGLHG